MRILMIKTSSMGDVIHTLPALTDAAEKFPVIQFDWVVEEKFAEIPAWHANVARVLPVAIRRWRKNILSKETRHEWRTFCESLRAVSYDYVIDAQGLYKSAFLMRYTLGERCGFDWRSAREPLASLCYQKKISVPRQQHAITRVRQLMAGALGYAIPKNTPLYGISREQFRNASSSENYLVFLHGTTWVTKHWPESYWIALGQRARDAGLKIKLPWGNEEEHARAQRIAAVTQAEVLPRLSIAEMATVLANAKAVVAVDTGLAHLTAALDVPAISLYGPTDPQLTGALGKSQQHIGAQFECAPCFNRVCSHRDYSPLKFPPCFATAGVDRVWSLLMTVL